jgi:hypothetical protein
MKYAENTGKNIKNPVKERWKVHGMPRQPVFI